MKKRCISLAELLFDMEADTINNNPEFHFDFNDWFNKFGDSSIEFAGEFKTKDKDVKELALLIEADFNLGQWDLRKDKKESLYNYQMPEYYGSFITKKFEEQLGDLTKVGTQLELEII